MLVGESKAVSELSTNRINTTPSTWCALIEFCFNVNHPIFYSSPLLQVCYSLYIATDVSEDHVFVSERGVQVQVHANFQLLRMTKMEL